MELLKNISGIQVVMLLGILYLFFSWNVIRKRSKILKKARFLIDGYFEDLIIEVAISMDDKGLPASMVFRGYEAIYTTSGVIEGEECEFKKIKDIEKGTDEELLLKDLKTLCKEHNDIISLEIMKQYRMI